MKYLQSLVGLTPTGVPIPLERLHTNKVYTALYSKLYKMYKLSFFEFHSSLRSRRT
jgi:hypothetical protein